MRTGALTSGGSIFQTGQNYLSVASGTTAQRPKTVWNGMMRYNTDTHLYEFYSQGIWYSMVNTTMLQAQIAGYGGGNSEPMLFVPDSTRSDKKLSVESTNYTYTMNSINNDDWCLVDSSISNDAGHIMPFAGTITRVAAYVTYAFNNQKKISVYLNNTETTNVLYLNGLSTQANISGANVTANIDFAAGDKLRLRARTGGATGNGNFQSVVINVTVKWRAP